MTEQSNAALIAEAGHAILTNDYERAYHGGLVERLATALKAAEQRADLAEADLDVELDKNSGYREKNDQLAAVVEKVRNLTADPGGFTYKDFDRIARGIPADALRGLKADVWDEGHHAGLRQADYEYGAAGFQVVKPNPYRREEKGRG